LLKASAWPQGVQQPVQQPPEGWISHGNMDFAFSVVTWVGLRASGLGKPCLPEEKLTI
jgi:hypothetical protein